MIQQKIVAETPHGHIVHVEGFDNRNQYVVSYARWLFANDHRNLTIHKCVSITRPQGKSVWEYDYELTRRITP